jgi:acyl-CoA thioester hydrolase
VAGRLDARGEDAGSAEAPASAFSIPLRIDAADVDELGHVNNAVYLRWVQEVATAHWATLAPEDARFALGWVVLRHEIDYRAPALPGDQVRARTWVGRAAGLEFERFTEIVRSADDRVLARARTLWCPIDAASGRPRRVPPVVRDLFST